MDDIIESIEEMKFYLQYAFKWKLMKDECFDFLINRITFVHIFQSNLKSIQSIKLFKI